MPILRVVRAHASVARAMARRAAMARAMPAIRIRFWASGELLGSKVPQNERFPALDADEPLCKI